MSKLQARAALTSALIVRCVGAPLIELSMLLLIRPLVHLLSATNQGRKAGGETQH